jgi:hypothetical protein
LGEGRVSGADDIIATLSSRVSELGKRVAVLQSELESAQRRLAVYEEHDSSIQDALSGALRAAYQIRERAETTAAQILEQAREERRLLLKEIERLRDERDQLQDEIAERRRGGISALAPRPLTTDAAATEIRQLASEALRGLFQEIVDDIRSAPRPAPAPASAPEAPREHPVAPPAEPVVAAAPRPEPVPVPTAPPPAATTPAPEPEVAAAPPAAPPPTEEIPTPSAAAEDIEPAARAAPRLEVVPGAPPFGSEIEEIAPPRVAEAAPASELQIVIAPVGSFPRLVEIERHIQALPPVRTLYVRDFRAGTATLAVALRSPMTATEFGGMLASLEQVRLRVMSSARNVIELRIEGEASIA